MNIGFGSVCSGIEAASIAWHPLGFRAQWFSEIEPFPSAVLAHHWPAVPNLGDMTQLAAGVRAGRVPAPAVLVGGTPCQSFSVVGVREGLKDPRGQLTISYVELADAIDDARTAAGEEPAVIVWENVPGVFSSSDNAFGAFLGLLAGEDCELQPTGKKWTNAGYVRGPRRTIAWRVLDAQFFSVPQSRRRVYVVASARKDISPAEILFESEGLSGAAAPRREAAGDASGIQGSTGAGNGDHEGPRFAAYGGGNRSGERSVAACLTAKGQRIDYEVETFLVQYDKNGHWLAPDLTVRRLTPLECERLQGFPDGHSKIPWRGKIEAKCPDAPRYKAIGNSMAVPVMRWIGQRILSQFASNTLTEDAL